MTEKKNKGGRPVTWTEEKRDKLCDVFEEWLVNPKHFWFKDFIYEQKMHLDTWHKIAKENPRLRGLIKKAKLKQQNFLVKGGLFSKTHPGFTQFLLRTNYKEEYGEEDVEKKGTTINVFSKKFSCDIEQEQKEGEEASV